MAKKALWLPVLVLTATTYAGISIRSPANLSSSSGPHPGRPECPHDWDFKNGQMPAIGPNIDVPEFHDCQRFIRYVEGVPRYDSLFAIFATDSLQYLDTTLRTLDPDSTGKVAIGAAEVYAEGTYEHLGIQSMFNCLYLFRDPNWRAKMVPVGRVEVDCGRSADPDTLEGMDLQVVPESLWIQRFLDADIPPVVRWDWDSANAMQYIGIKCGADWCDIGKPGFHPTRPQPIGFGVPPGLRRTRMVKGWFDEQLLADTAPTGELKPSTIWATIYPDPGLDGFTVANFRQRWIHVADVSLTDRSAAATPINPYKARMNLDFTNPGGPLNAIYLCYGTKAACHPNILGPCDGDGMWWGRVDDATRGDGSPPHFMCTVRRSHGGLEKHVIGTSRWRWTATDETTWKRCDNGCCELH